MGGVVVDWHGGRNRMRALVPAGWECAITAPYHASSRLTVRPAPNRPFPSSHRAIDELACPAGFYCPTPANKLRCPAGYFCPPSTIQPVTCNMSMLVDRAPLLKVPDKPLTVVQVRGCWAGSLCFGSNPGCPPGASRPHVTCDHQTSMP